MTESTANAAVAPAKSPSFWEDVIDIFYQPAEVFRRREGKSSWPPLLFVAIAMGVIVFATFNVLQPIFDAEFARATRRRSQRVRKPPMRRTRCATVARRSASLRSGRSC